MCDDYGIGDGGRPCVFVETANTQYFLTTWAMVEHEHHCHCAVANWLARNPGVAARAKEEIASAEAERITYVESPEFREILRQMEESSPGE